MRGFSGAPGCVSCSRARSSGQSPGDVQALVKSAIRMRPGLPGVWSMFSGFMSRWMMPIWCNASMPRALGHLSTPSKRTAGSTHNLGDPSDDGALLHMFLDHREHVRRHEILQHVVSQSRESNAGSLTNHEEYDSFWVLDNPMQLHEPFSRRLVCSGYKLVRGKFGADSGEMNLVVSHAVLHADLGTHYPASREFTCCVRHAKCSSVEHSHESEGT